MPHPTVEEFGIALYGPDWKADMQMLLGVEERTLRRWMADPGAVPAGVTDELYQAAAERAQLLQRILAQKEESGFQRQVNATMRAPTPRDRRE